MRPKSIMLFESTYWAWLAANLLSLVIGWPQTAAEPQMQQVLSQMPWFPYAVIGVMVALLAWLGIAVARKASNIGRWIFVVIAVVALLLVVPGLAGGAVPTTLADWLIVVAAVLAAVAAVALFRPDARAWFAAASPIDTAPVE